MFPLLFQASLAVMDFDPRILRGERYAFWLNVIDPGVENTFYNLSTNLEKGLLLFWVYCIFWFTTIILLNNSKINLGWNIILKATQHCNSCFASGFILIFHKVSSMTCQPKYAKNTEHIMNCWHQNMIFYMKIKQFFWYFTSQMSRSWSI